MKTSEYMDYRSREPYYVTPARRRKSRNWFGWVLFAIFVGGLTLVKFIQ